MNSHCGTNSAEPCDRWRESWPARNPLCDVIVGLSTVHAVRSADLWQGKGMVRRTYSLMYHWLGTAAECLRTHFSC